VQERLATRIRSALATLSAAAAVRTLQSYILALFLAVMVAVQVGGYVLINTVGMSAARKSIGEDLVAGALVFDRLLEQERHRLVQGAQLMSADYTFREVIASGDLQTIASVPLKYGRRIDASLMMIVGLDQRVLGDTLDDATGKAFPFPELIVEAESSQKASAMVLINGRLYQLIVVPVLAPTPIAWVAIGFIVDDGLTQDFRRLTRLDVSFFSRQTSDGWQLQASTLATEERTGLLSELAAERFANRDGDGNAEYSGEAVTRVIALPARSREAVVAVLQEPVASALEPFGACSGGSRSFRSPVSSCPSWRASASRAGSPVRSASSRVWPGVSPRATTRRRRLRRAWSRSATWPPPSAPCRTALQAVSRGSWISPTAIP